MIKNFFQKVKGLMMDNHQEETNTQKAEAEQTAETAAAPVEVKHGAASADVKELRQP